MTTNPKTERKMLLCSGRKDPDCWRACLHRRAHKVNGRAHRDEHCTKWIKCRVTGKNVRCTAHYYVKDEITGKYRRRRRLSSPGKHGRLDGVKAGPGKQVPTETDIPQAEPLRELQSVRQKGLG